MSISNKQPVFEINFEDTKLSGYQEANIVLMKLHQKGKSRNLRTGKYGLAAGVQTGLNEGDIIAIDIDPTTNGNITITPREELKKGQYCFYYTGDVKEDTEPSIYVYDFEIK